MSENFKIIFMLDAIYTVFHKKRGSTFVIITLQKLVLSL